MVKYIKIKGSNGAFLFFLFIGYNLDMNNNILKLRIILWHILVIIVLFFVYMAIVPSGHISYVCDMQDDNPFISSISPKDRIGETNNNGQKIIGDPVYFSLETPRTFSEANLEIKFKNNNPEENPIIEAGVLVDKTIWRYKLSPLDNYFLDNLYNQWDYSEKGNLVLFTNPAIASSTFYSVDDFLANPPRMDEIATYNYDLKTDYILDNYSSSTKIISLDKKLRGPFQVLTYIDNEDFYFDFTFSDLNKNKDSDEINLNLYYEDQLVDSKHLDDDGIVNDLGKIRPSRNIGFELANMPQGVYKIELRVNEDIVTEKIQSKQNKISFLNKIWLEDASAINLPIFTDSNVIFAQTTNPASLQEIKFASSSLDIENTYRQYSANLEATSTEILIQKGDVILAGNGVFSFDQQSLFDPKIKKIDSSFKLPNSGINYILADYKKPQKEGEYFVSGIKVDLSGAYRENSKYSFLISIPGLRADDDIDDSVEIDSIRVDLQGTDLIGKIKSLFN